MRDYILLFTGLLFSFLAKANTPIATQIEANTRLVVETTQTLLFQNLSEGQEIDLKVRYALTENNRTFVDAGALGKGIVIELYKASPTEPAAISIAATKIQTTDGSWVETQSFPEVFHGFQNGVDRVEVLAGSIFRVLTKATPNAEASIDSTSALTVIPLGKPLDTELAQKPPQYTVPITESQAISTLDEPIKGSLFNGFALDSLQGFEINLYLDSVFTDIDLSANATLPLSISEDLYSEDGFLIIAVGTLVLGRIQHRYGNTLYVVPHSIRADDGTEFSLIGPLVELELEETEEGIYLSEEFEATFKK